MKKHEHKEEQLLHTDYSQPITADVRREHMLHRVVALSAFVFALCILPVAQHFLTNGTSTVADTEQGEVAGVSTESSTFADIPVATETPTAEPTSLAECQARKTQDRADLDVFLAGKKKAMLSAYELYVAQLGGADAASTQEAKDERAYAIEKAYENYMKELTLVEAAVATQATTIDSYACPAQ